MKLEKLSCPAYGAAINMDIKEQKTIFCPFCGTQFAIDDGSKTITKNININSKYTDDAAIERERRKDRQNAREHKENKWSMIGFIIILAAFFALIGIMAFKEENDKKKSIEAGMIQLGQSSEDIEGEKYQSIVKKLESAGFTNIDAVDLDDAGWITDREDTIDSMSVDGDKTFNKSDYFKPDSKIIIFYH